MPKTKKGRQRRFVPYARGFRPPTNQHKRAALGSVPAGREYDIYVDGVFKSIPKCTSVDDWLAQYDEEGQTFPQFLEECPWLSSRKRKSIKQDFNKSGKNLLEKYPTGAIYLVPLGDFNTFPSPDFEALRRYAEIFLGIPVKTLPAVQLEYKNRDVFWVNPSKTDETNGRRKSTRREKLNSRYNAKNGRVQLCIDKSLVKMKEIMPDNAICTIALTMADLYCDNTDLFVAGMAAGNHRVAIFSFHRYDPVLTFSTEFWHDIKIDPTCKDMAPEDRTRLVLHRSCKLLVHEVCHLLGFDHCIYFECCMNGSGHLAEDFRQPMFMCPVDLRKLQHLIGFSVVERYENMLTFFKEHDFKDDCEWLEKRLSFIREGKI